MIENVWGFYLSPNILGCSLESQPSDEPFIFISEEVASWNFLCQEPGPEENSLMGYMGVPIPGKDVPQGCFRAAKLLLGELPEKRADATEIIVLMAMYEMDMDHFP